MANQEFSFIKRNGFSVHPEFHKFMESNVVPATSMESDEFWQAFTDTLNSGADLPPFYCGHQVCESQLEVSLGDASLTLNAINSRWGSLYDTLYQNNIIPHCAGLKPGNGDNHARRDRVISCAKDFLDRTFPLREGSHRDAVSYMVYYQNLLVILADGTTTGLDTPIQFVGKNGPTNEPESILLKHRGIHAEVIFDRNGKVGEHDLANIDDIQLEAADHTLLNFSAASVSEKCSTYQRWIKLVANGCNERTFTGSDGNVLALDQSNWAIKLSEQHPNCQLVIDPQGNSVSNACLDALTAALIYSIGQHRAHPLNMYVTDNSVGINDRLFTHLGQFLANARKDASDNSTHIKVSPTSADSLPQSKIKSTKECVPSLDNVVINAMASHGYDVAQALGN